MANDTIFDRILAGEIPATVVFEDEHVLAFKDVNPQAPVHVIVIPRKKLASTSDFSAADPLDLGHFIAGVAKAAKALELDRDGYRIVFNNGRHGQQTVAYVHAHILGGRSLAWPPG